MTGRQRTDNANAVALTPVGTGENAFKRTQDVSNESQTATFLFTDIEGSTRLWEREPARMQTVMRRHDELCPEIVASCGGRVIKGTGDGIHAVFEDAADAVLAMVKLQLAFAQPLDPDGMTLKIRAGLHCGPSEARGGDYFGSVVNRAARVMGVAHGGQALLTQAVSELVTDRLPSDVTLLDLGSVRLRDLAQPERVYQVQHPSLRSHFPALRSLEATPNNLTRQLNSFVGRERELREVGELLKRTRLLTLLGMGGIGKSRLSVQLGAELMDEYPDGVWLVELAPLADPQLVPQALANVLGIKEEAGGTVTEALLGYVRDKALLVILDNCEHVVDACADLAKRVLQAGAGVKVLATSRDVLQVAGETIYQVPTLTVPDAPDGNAVDPNQLAQHEAVRLFLDRASAVQQGFRLRSDNAAAVSEICRQLDGIPLAIELAAARMRALSVQAIAARLADRFRLLVSGDKTVLPRQRTLRALIDWSYELLSEPERILLRRLAVFAGGWTLEAAEAVCCGDELDPMDVLDLQTLLVQKSLVVMEPEGTRYRMLETVRAYANEKLIDSEGDTATRRRHVAHYVGIAEEAREHLVGPLMATWLPLLDLERENFVAVHAWCGTDESCRNSGFDLIFLLRTYWVAKGLLSLGLRLTNEALGRTSSADRTLQRCRVLCDAGVLEYHMGRYAIAREALTESRSIAIELGDQIRLLGVLPVLGFVLVAVGDTAGAISIYDSAITLAGELGQRRQQAIAMNALAQLHRTQGHLSEAHAQYDLASHQFAEMGDQEAVAIIELNIAMLEITQGEIARAATRLAGARPNIERLGSLPIANCLLEVAAGLCAANDNPSTCAILLGAAEHQAKQTGIQRDSEDSVFLEPLVARAKQAIGQARFEAQVANAHKATVADVASALTTALAMSKPIGLA